MLEVLPLRDKAIWAMAFFGGLRRGELWGLRQGDVDGDKGVIRVRNSEDAQEGRIDPKSRAGIRPVPITTHLADILDAYETERGAIADDGRYFPGARAGYTALRDRAKTAWTEAGLQPIGLHDARHSFASFLIAAGVNAKAIQTYMGHSSIGVTYDTYGHLFPGNEAEAASLLDAYIAQSVPKGVPAHGSS
jgi:integrase